VTFGNWRLAEALALTALVFIACLLAAYFFTGLYGSDDISYANILVALRSDTDFSPWASRWLVSLPYALFGQLFGLNPFWAVSIASIEYVLLVLCSVILARKLCSPWSALGAGFLVASCPLVLIYSGALLPDNILAIVILAQIFCALEAYEATTEWKLQRWSLLTGAMQALAYTVKEPALIFCVAGPVLLIALALRDLRYALKAAAAMACGFAIIFVLDLAIGAILFDNPFARFVGAELTFDKARERMLQRDGAYPLERIGKAAQFLSKSWSVGGVGIGPAFVPISILAPIIHFFPHFRQFGLILVSTTLSSMTLYHLAGSISLTEYIGVPLQVRYLAPAAVLLIILAVTIVDRILQLISAEWRVIGGAAALFLGIMFGCLSVYAAAPSAGQIYYYSLVQEFLTSYSVLRKRQPKVPIYAGPTVTKRILDYGLVHDVLPVLRLKGATKETQSPFLVLMTKQEGNPVEAGVLPDSVFDVRELNAEEHGIFTWIDRAAALKAVFGWRDPAAMIPLQDLLIFELRPAGRSGASARP